MTVRELIEFLSTAPQDAPVVYQCCSDYRVLEVESIAVQKSTDKCGSGAAVAHHNMPGEFRMYGGPWEHKGSPPPDLTDVVIFPGN